MAVDGGKQILELAYTLHGEEDLGNSSIGRILKNSANKHPLGAKNKGFVCYDFMLTNFSKDVIEAKFRQ